MTAKLATWWVAPDGEEKLDLDWRVGIPARHLPGVVHELNPWLFAQEGRCAIFRTANSIDALAAIEEAKRRQLRVLIESDDAWLLLDARTLALRRASLARRGEVAEFTRREAGRLENHRAAVEIADGVIVSTPFLAELYGQWNEHVYVCLNSVDPADWPQPVKPDDGIVRVGFAGSTSHIGDIAAIRLTLQWAAAEPGVEAVMIGFDPTADLASDADTAAAADAVEALDFAQRRGDRDVAEAALRAIDGVQAQLAARQASWRIPGLNVIPWVESWPAHRANLSTLDVGLAPLAPTAFNQGRSDSKVLEYLAAGVLPVVQRSEAYRAWFDVLPTVRDADEFLEHVQAAVNDPERTAARAAALREHVLRERSIERTIEQWRAAVTEASS